MEENVRARTCLRCGRIMIVTGGELVCDACKDMLELIRSKAEDSCREDA